MKKIINFPPTGTQTNKVNVVGGQQWWVKL